MSTLIAVGDAALVWPQGFLIGMLAFAVGHYFYIRSVRLRKLFRSLSWLSAEFQDSDIFGRQPGVQRPAGAACLWRRHWYLQLADQTWAG